MKISRVEVLCANRAVYAKVYTDNGLYGIGESGAWGLLAASGEAIKMFGEYLVGQDPLDIEHHWQYMYRFSHFRGAAVMGAISALDEALYDIAFLDIIVVFYADTAFVALSDFSCIVLESLE